MERGFWDRWAPASGIVYLVLYVVAIALVGHWPEPDDPAEDFAAFYADERGRAIGVSLLAAAAMLFFLWFATVAAARVRELGARRLSTAVVAGSAAYVGMSLASLGTGLGLVAQDAAGEVDPTVIKTVEALGDGIWVVAWLPLALVVLAVGVAMVRNRTFPSWFGPASIVAAVAIGLGATTWARSGFWAPFGGYVLLIWAPVLFAWVLAASILLLVRPATSPGPEGAVPGEGREAARTGA